MDSRKKLLIGAVGIILIIAIGIGSTALSHVGSPSTSRFTGEPQIVHNVFIDVNGDGKVDLLVTGEVIFDGDFLAPTPSR